MEEFNSADILEKQNRKKRLAFLEVGLFEVSFVLITIIVLFGVLNYLNILSLSTLYPNTFGFLPHQITINKTQIPIVNVPTIIPMPTQTTIYTFTPTNNASAGDISNYSITAKNFAKPYYNADVKSFVAEGILSAYNDNSISLITATGTMNFTFTKDTTFNKFTSAVNKENAVTIDNLTKETFLTKDNLGKKIQIYYLDSNKITEVYLSFE